MRAPGLARVAAGKDVVLPCLPDHELRHPLGELLRGLPGTAGKLRHGPVDARLIRGG
jgi:hypothetical protein